MCSGTVRPDVASGLWFQCTLRHPCDLEDSQDCPRLSAGACGRRCRISRKLLPRSAYRDIRPFGDTELQRQQNNHDGRRRRNSDPRPRVGATRQAPDNNGQIPHRWDFVHDEVGFNYRMPNLNAALGCAQLEQLPDFLASKRALFMRYQHAFQDLPEVELVKEPPKCQSNYWLQTLKLSNSVASERDAILSATNDAGLMTRPAWKLLHQLAPYQQCPRAPLPVGESLARRLINIPSSASLGVTFPI